MEFRPAERSHDISHSREVESAAIHHLIFSPNRIDVIICHAAKLLDQLFIDVQVFESVDEFSKVFIR